MRVSLFLFILGVIFIVVGYTRQLDPLCQAGTRVKIVPRSEYYDLLKDSAMNANMK